MSLLDAALPGGRRWTRVGDSYEVTKKARNTDRNAHASIPFIPMDAIPQNGAYAPTISNKAPGDIASGTYFERGDILVAKITPSFENGKQALVSELDAPFGYATTEVIPLRPKNNDQDRRLLFYYLLHPDIRSHVAERMEGSTGRQRVPEHVLLDLAIPEFDRDDQSAIADALELVQRASALARQGEENARDLKRALMSDLFTRGLRGEAQKETIVGRMPASWEPRTLLQLSDIWSGGTPRKSVGSYWSGEIPWVSGKDLKRPLLIDSIDHLTPDGVANGSRLAPAGSVLILVRGMGLAKDLPVAVIGREMAFNQDIKAL